MEENQNQQNSPLKNDRKRNTQIGIFQDKKQGQSPQRKSLVQSRERRFSRKLKTFKIDDMDVSNQQQQSQQDIITFGDTSLNNPPTSQIQIQEQKEQLEDIEELQSQNLDNSNNQNNNIIEDDNNDITNTNQNNSFDQDNNNIQLNDNMTQHSLHDDQSLDGTSRDQMSLSSKKFGSPLKDRRSSIRQQGSQDNLQAFNQRKQIPSFSSQFSIENFQEEDQLIKQKTSGRAKKIACVVVGIPFLIILGVVIYLLFLKKQDKELFQAPCQGINRDADKECSCIQGYYQKGEQEDCVGPFDQTYTEEDIKVSLVGQEKNFVTRIQKPRQLEQYTYQIENIQENLVDGQKVQNVTKISHNIGILTQNVTDTHFDVVAFITNSTIIQGSTQYFIEGYPGAQDGENQQQQGENQGETLDTSKQNFTEWQQKLMQDHSLSEEKFALSLMPIVRAQINKTGEIHQITYPINLRSDIKEIFPSILNQYSPPLDTSKYNTVDSIDKENKNKGNNRRRRLQQNDTAHLENQQPGFYTQNEQPQYNAEVDEITNSANLQKNYEVSSKDTQGQSIEQDTSFGQQTQIESGRVQQSKVSASMQLNNPDRAKQEEENLDSVEPGSKPGMESKNLLEGMKIFQNTTFEFQLQEILSKNFTDTILTHLELNYLLNQTYKEFQEYLNEEKKYQNEQFKETNANITEGQAYEYSGYDINEDEDLALLEQQQEEEAQNNGGRRMLSSNNKKKNKDKNGNNTDDNNEENKKDDKNQVDEFGNKIDKNAKALINRFKVQLFKFSLLGIDVKGFQEFWCNYGPKGSKKDLCFLRPALYLGKFSLSIKEFKFRVALSKIVKRFNYYRAKILDRITAVTDTIGESLDNINGNATEVIDAINNVLNVEDNGIAPDFRLIKQGYSKILNATYGNFSFDFDSLLKIQQDTFTLPVEKIKDDVKSYLHKFFNKIDFVWQNLQDSYQEILQNALQEILNKEKISQNTCGAIQGIHEEFQDFSQDYLINSKKIIYNILDAQVFQPLSEFFSSLDFLPGDQVSAFSNIANAVVTNFIQGKINSLLEDTTIYQEKYLEQLQQKVKTVVQEVDNGLGTIVQKCNEKIDTLLPHDQNEDAFLDELLEQLNLSDYISADELSLSPQNLKNQASTIIKREFLEYFKDLFLSQHTNQSLIKNKLVNFNDGVQDGLAQGIFEFSSNIIKMSIKVGNTVVDTVDTITGGVSGLITTVKTLVPNLRQAVKEGNKENGELDEALDIDNLSEQIDSIMSFVDSCKDTVELVENAKQVPQNFQIMKDFIDEITSTPFHELSNKKMNISQEIEFDEQDLNGALFKKFIQEKQQQIEQTVDTNLKQKIQSSHLTTFNEKIQQSQLSLQEDMELEVFSQMTDINTLFKNQLKKLLENFELEKQRIFEKPLYNIGFEKEFTYPTPIGIPLFIAFALDAQISIALDLGIQGRAVEVTTELALEVTAEAMGGITVLIARLGAYIEAVLFHGAIALAIAVGFSTKLFGHIAVKAILYPFSISLGLFVQYRTITFEKKCFGIGCARICIPVPTIDWSDKIDLVDPWQWDLTDTMEKELFKFEW